VIQNPHLAGWEASIKCASVHVGACMSVCVCVHALLWVYVFA